MFLDSNPNVIADWKFSKGKVNDVTYTLSTASQNPIFTQDKNQKCISFSANMNGTSNDSTKTNYLQTSYNANLNPASAYSIIVVCDFFPVRRSGGGYMAYYSPYTARSNTSGLHGLMFYAKYITGNTFRWNYWFGNGSAWVFLENPSSIEFQKRYVLIATYDGTTTRFYVDGVEVATSTDAFSANPDMPTRIGCGETETATPASTHFNGNIYRVAILNTAISSSDVTTLQTQLTKIQKLGTRKTNYYMGSTEVYRFKEDCFYNESFGDETSGFLSNSEWRINSGTWKINNNQEIECVADGEIEWKGVDTSTSTTNTFTYSGTASLTKGSDSLKLVATAGATISKIILTP